MENKVQIAINEAEEIDSNTILKEELIDADDDDPIEYEPLDDGMYFEETTEVEQYDEEILDNSDIIQEDYQVEVVVDDTKVNAPQISNKVGSIAKYSPSSTSLQASTSELMKNEGFLIIEMENNQRFYQCEICNKTCKDKTKLKLHREIHTDQRNVICQVN